MCLLVEQDLVLCFLSVFFTSSRCWNGTSSILLFRNVVIFLSRSVVIFLSRNVVYVYA